MENRLNVEMELIDDGLKFRATAGDHPEIITDYIPPLGHNEGYTPLQLFLISFGTCASGVLLPLLRKMHRDVRDFSVHVSGIRRTEHPTGFSKIIMNISFRSNDTTREDVEKILQMAKEKYCPVWSMLDDSMDIESNIEIG